MTFPIYRVYMPWVYSYAVMKWIEGERSCYTHENRSDSVVGRLGNEYRREKVFPNATTPMNESSQHETSFLIHIFHICQIPQVIGEARWKDLDHVLLATQSN